MCFKRQLFALLLLIVGAVLQLSAQSAVTVGSQVTSESGIVSGKAYVLKTGANRYITDSGSYYDVNDNSSAAASASEASVYYLISNGDGTWKIKNFYTGKYWGVPVYNTALAPSEESAAGAWSLNFSSNIAYPSAPDASSTTRGIDRSGGKVWGWSTGDNNNHKVYIYEVAKSSTALSEFTDKDMTVNSTAASSLTTGTWYVMSQRSRTSYVFENTSDHKLKHTLTKPDGSATEKAGYLVRLISADGGKYYLQNGYGNYIGAIAASTNVPTTALPEEAITVAKIASTDGHFYLQGTTNGVVLDANDFSGGDPSTVVGWGTTAPTSTGGNNDWAFYPVTLEDSWVPTISEVYTINNTNANRGAMMYNSSSSYVWSSGKSGTFDATSPNCQWVVVPTGTAKQFYLYNVGAGKFAIPSSTASTASWIFSSNAVAITFITQSDGTRKIKTATTDTYAAVSNGFNGPIINYNDVGGNFTITKVDGDQSTAANAALAKLADNITPLSAIPADGTSDWYIIRIKTHGTYADKYVYPAASEITYSSTNYPLTFDHGANVRPAIDDAAYYTRIINESNKVYWQLPNGKYLYGVNDKFPVSTSTKSTFSMDYTSGQGMRFWGGQRYAVPYLLSSKYFIGETSSTGNAYYDVYPINLTTAGLTAWQVILDDGLDASTQITCTRSDASGLTSIYTNGFVFLPTGSTNPVKGDFTASIGGSAVTMNVTVDTDAKTVTLSLPVLTINSPMAEATFTWNGESKTGKSVIFVNPGNSISDPAITVTYTGNVYTSPTLSQDTWDGTESATVTCTMTPAFFSTNYGDKWVRIQSAKTTNLVVYLTGTSAGSSAKLKTHDYMDESQLWCFVGNSNAFTLYNKAAGEDYVLASASSSPGQNTTIALQASGSANSTWTLGDKFSSSDAPGYSVYLSGTSGEYGLHGWQSDGTAVKFWGTGSGGSHYLIEDASGEVTLVLDGLDPTKMDVYTQNIAVLPSTVAGSSSTTLLTKDNIISRTVYVPSNTVISFGTPKMFMNYGFIGYDGNDQSKEVTATTTPQTITATFSVVRPDARYLWQPLRKNVSDYYRIPAIVTAKNGDVIAINDRRFNNAHDIGNNHHIDLIGVASSDNGKTWSDEFMIMDGDNGGEKAYGDAAVVADRESNKVLVMACGGNVSYQSSTTSNHQVIARSVLTHNGTTWEASAITTQTSQFYSGDLASCPAMFIGSGSITQSSIIKKGDYYRIYCAVLAKDYGNYVLYSDNFGENWTYLGSASSAASGDEAKVSELPDGSVLLSSRKAKGRYFNVWTWTDDTYTTGSWGSAVATNDQTGGISYGNNSTNGDIRMIPAKRVSDGTEVVLAMQSIPTGSSRSNVSLYYKELDPAGSFTDPVSVAQNWSGPFQVTPHQSAYSAFNQQADGRIAFFMEESPIQVTEANVGYYMCYVPLSLYEITNKQYTAASFDVTLNVVDGKSYATLYLPYDVTTTGNTKAYYILSANKGATQLTATNNDGTEIPAKTAVVLVNEDGDASASMNATADLVSVVDEDVNLLKGTLVPMTLDLGNATTYYALGQKNDKIGFYKFDNATTTSINLGANKAYLDTSAQASEARGFVFDFDNPTGIESMNDGQGTMYDGQGTMYDLSGRRVNSLKRGIYIVNGKKVIK